jgi:hypothetical protein
MEEVNLTHNEDRELQKYHARYMRKLPPRIRNTINMKCRSGFRFLRLSDRIFNQILMDEEASYSITEASLADVVTDEILRVTRGVNYVTDATACIGGNTINFAHRFSHVNAVEIDPIRAKYLKHNTKLMCYIGTVTVLNGDYTHNHKTLKQDLVFLDPPWGGPSYTDFGMDQLHLSLSNKDLAVLCLELDTKYIAVKVPYNFAFSAFLKDTHGILTELCRTPIGRSIRTNKPSFILTVLEKSAREKC